MTSFDKLLESMTRKITKMERYPSKIKFSEEFLALLEEEYEDRLDDGESNRNFHSNILKALSFKLDEIKGRIEKKKNIELEDAEIIIKVLDEEDEDKKCSDKKCDD